MDRQGKKTDATEMRHYITLQSKTSTTDSEGGFSEAWGDIASHWAAVYPISARQKFDLTSINVDATHVIKIRGEIEVFEEYRIKFGSRYFEILTVEDLQERGICKLVITRENR